MEVMYHRKNGKRYEVYDYITDEGKHTYAICYDTDQAGRCGQGWCKMRLKDLIPEAHVNKATGAFESNSSRAKAKKQMKLVAATWECTDGLRYDHSQIEDAIAHQLDLMRAEWAAR